MKNMLRSLLLLASAAAVVTLGPVGAQETAPPAEPAQEAPPAADEAPPDEGEALSADNGLSFPVDI
jgi:hypothetical protein